MLYSFNLYSFVFCIQNKISPSNSLLATHHLPAECIGTMENGIQQSHFKCESYQFIPAITVTYVKLPAVTRIPPANQIPKILQQRDIMNTVVSICQVSFVKMTTRGKFE